MLPEEYVLDRFLMDDGREIIVLDSKLFNALVEEDSMVLCKVLEENGQSVIYPLDDEEEEEACQQYCRLVTHWIERQQELDTHIDNSHGRWSGTELTEDPLGMI